ncbi:enoyl-CoA hydratase-related protein [Xanthobacter versatilis]|uniref:enoyl-CoA hydratase-related protein n=1 Tax=Xanthobacter autotrophicus (strain ATCC BAA-1158 / Py2) TaxID=78245 RepID=UPI00372ACAA6
MTERPKLTQFRIEDGREGIIHLVFDMPGRSMNVFSNAAIDDIGAFARWLATSDVRGCVVRSGKASAFCAGADLPEIEAMLDTIRATPAEERIKVTFDHFFRLSQGLRELETSGKPVVAAIAGLALGGGCELALACHFRVMTTAPASVLGLPESLVGLLPGAGGTQRMPRLVGAHQALPILLDGARFDGAAAVAAGAAHKLVPPGEEVAAAERWILGAPDPRQPWDRPDWHPMETTAVSAGIAPQRARRMAETHGHVPAITAILDCVEEGLPLPIEDALAKEMDIFSRLVQRPEPRAMIRSLFVGRVEFEKRQRTDALPQLLPLVLTAVRDALETAEAAARGRGANEAQISEAKAFAGFTPSSTPSAPASPRAAAEGFWFEAPGLGGELARAAEILKAAALATRPYLTLVDGEAERIIDYAAITQLGFPAYTGGPLSLARRLMGPSAPYALSGPDYRSGRTK